MIPRAIKFKNKELGVEFDRLDKRLQHVIYWLAGWISLNTKTGYIVITSLFRDDNKDSVHYYGRGADIRTWSFVNNEDDPAEIEKIINQEFDYGDGVHQTALYHDNRGERGMHIHIQVKP